MRGLIACFVLPATVLLAGAADGAVTQLPHPGRETEYFVRNLSSLGGTSSGGSSINELSWVAGFSNLPGDETTHASLWLYGLQIDLGTLGGPNSAVLWPVKNNRGLIVGVAETNRPDPLKEDWSCSFFFPERTGKTCLGFVWKKGEMRPLPTLGGNNGFAAGANNRGEVVGWAENTVHDPSCNPPQVLQFHAVVWGPGRGEIRQLPPLPGDTAGAATAINDRGQVVGISGICDNAVGRFSAAHAVLWEDGEATEISNLGGVAWNTPMAINERGQVVGFSDLPGDDDGEPNYHAFLWTERDDTEDLGTLPGDVYSQALGINERGQIVGLSCTAGFESCRAFFWQDGVMTDLNELVAPGYRDHLYYANDINDHGMITGLALDESTGESSAFFAIPIPRRRGADGTATAAGGQASVPPSGEVLLPDAVRRSLLRRLGLGNSELAR